MDSDHNTPQREMARDMTPDRHYISVSPELREKILFHSDLSDRAKIMFCVLASMAGKQGKCWPSQDWLSERLNISRDTVKRAIRELEQNSLVFRRRDQDKKGRPNYYELITTEPTGKIENNAPDYGADLPCNNQEIEPPAPARQRANLREASDLSECWNQLSEREQKAFSTFCLTWEGTHNITMTTLQKTARLKYALKIPRERRFEAIEKAALFNWEFPQDPQKQPILPENIEKKIDDAGDGWSRFCDAFNDKKEAFRQLINEHIGTIEERTWQVDALRIRHAEALILQIPESRIPAARNAMAGALGECDDTPASRTEAIIRALTQRTNR